MSRQTCLDPEMSSRSMRSVHPETALVDFGERKAGENALTNDALGRGACDGLIEFVSKHYTLTVTH